MKKLLVFALASMTIFACTNQNDPSQPSTTTIEGELTGAFSVGASKKVHFAQGNLQYQASTNTWRFAQYQYDTCGSSNDSASATFAGWIDRFGYGASGYKGMYPWYKWDIYSGNTPIEPLTENISETNYDWGVYNKISNGGNRAGLWRTLTSYEWLYIFQERTNAAYLFGLGTVNGVNGLILLPDCWETPSDITFIPSILKGMVWKDESDRSYGYRYFYEDTVHIDGESDLYKLYHYEDNIYSLSEWNELESYGAVFLPVTEENISRYGSWGIGIYWTSTYSDFENSDSKAGEGPGTLCFYHIFVAPYISEYEKYAASIRLARDVK